METKAHAATPTEPSQADRELALRITGGCVAPHLTELYAEWIAQHVAAAREEAVKEYEATKGLLFSQRQLPIVMKQLEEERAAHEETKDVYLRTKEALHKTKAALIDTEAELGIARREVLGATMARDWAYENKADLMNNQEHLSQRLTAEAALADKLANGLRTDKQYFENTATLFHGLFKYKLETRAKEVLELLDEHAAARAGRPLSTTPHGQ